MRGQHIGRGGNFGDGGEIFLHIERHFFVEMRIGGHDGRAAHQQRVAIGRGARHDFTGDNAVAAAAVVVHDGLAEQFAHGQRHRASDDIRAAACGKGDYPAYGAGGEVLRGCSCGRHQ